MYDKSRLLSVTPFYFKKTNVYVKQLYAHFEFYQIANFSASPQRIIET